MSNEKQPSYYVILPATVHYDERLKYANNIYAVINEGIDVEYIDMENGWAKTKYKNKILYCGSKYLK